VTTPRPILIAGPTASGKTALAIALAQATGGTVFNADSQQIYSDWRMLTARPTQEEEATVPHHLFGHVPLDQEYSVGHWLREIGPKLATCKTNEQRAIIVGGTGLYFKALTEGLAPIPEVPAEVRARGEADLERLGLAAFTQALKARDPETVATLATDNPRRVLRAWEVLEASGLGLADWRARTPAPLLPLDQAVAIALMPPRDWLYARCEARFDAMLESGALEEVRTVMAMDVPAAAPGLRALGAPELSAHLRGDLTLEDATILAKQETRRYAKRQLTWLRNQMGAWERLDPSQPDFTARALAVIC
jgi:tRNA dimethylallyltransferase